MLCGHRFAGTSSGPSNATPPPSGAAAAGATEPCGVCRQPTPRDQLMAMGTATGDFFVCESCAAARGIPFTPG